MLRLSQLADLIDGTLSGDPEIEITDAKITAHAGQHDITFVTNPDSLESFLKSPAPAAIVSQSVFEEVGTSQADCAKSTLVVANAEIAFTTVVKRFRPPLERKKIGISPAAHVSPTAEIGEGVDIYPNAFVGDGVKIGAGSTIFPGVCILENCEIGQRVRIYPNAVLYENTIVGDDGIIHAGVVLGAFGFGYKSSSSGHELSAQLGNVVLGAKVEIGANSAIDRATFDSTTIGEGTKLDDLVMIGHNCSIGAHNLLCSQVGIAGSCSTGNFVVMAGQVGIGDHIDIGNKVTLLGKSGVMHNIEDGQTMLGIPATPLRSQMQLVAIRPKLPEMRRTIKQLKKRLDAIEDDCQGNEDTQPSDQQEAA